MLKARLDRLRIIFTETLRAGSDRLIVSPKTHCAAGAGNWLRDRCAGRPRIPAQRSVFTVHKHPDKPYDLPDRLEKLLLKKLRPESRPLDYRLNLDACGINMASMFPDINGLAEYVSWLYKWERLPPSL